MATKNTTENRLKLDIGLSLIKHTKRQQLLVTLPRISGAAVPRSVPSGPPICAGFEHRGHREQRSFTHVRGFELCVGPDLTQLCVQKECGLNYGPSRPGPSSACCVRRHFPVRPAQTHSSFLHQNLNPGQMIDSQNSAFRYFSKFCLI